MGKRKGKKKTHRQFGKWLTGILILSISTLFATHWKDNLPPASAPKYEELEIPSRLFDREEQIIRHTGYTVSYNEFWRLPNWVGYELTREKARGTVARAKHFKADPLVQGISADNRDYSRSGYDRGHMAPAADMKWSTRAMKESFYFSNICPQLHNLNAGDWKELEESIREWAHKDSAIIVISGPIIKGSNPRRIGVNQIAVPEAFFKVVLAPYLSKPKAIGFIMKQEKGNHPLRSYVVSVDSVEKLTGIDFFPVLPDDIENKVEAKAIPREWGL